jgi:hypothetical protein
MDMGFLANPVNMGIFSGSVLLLAGMALFFLRKRSVQVSKEHGIRLIPSTESRLVDRIPLIDRSLQGRLNGRLNDMKDIIISYAAGACGDMVVHLLYQFKVLQAVRDRIYENHFSRILSDETESTAWVKRVTETVMYKLNYAKAYCNLQIDTEVFRDPTERLLVYVLREFRSFVRDSISEKLTFYQQLEQTEKTKELIEKNERYLRGINR